MLAYNTIVVGTDFSRIAEDSASAAIAMASRFGARRVHLVHVISAPVVPLIDPRREAALEKAKARASTKLDDMELPETTCWVSREVRVGHPARELSLTADGLNADLLVVSRRGTSGLARLVLGSVAGSLIRVSTTPVLVIGDQGPPESFERVLAAVDLSPISRRVLKCAVAVAHASRAELDVLSLSEDPLLTQGPDDILPHPASKDEKETLHSEHKSQLLDLIEAIPKAGIDPNVIVEGRGSPPGRILENAKERGADLIVMGTSGQNAWHRMLLGSTAHNVLVRAPCAVLVVPQLSRSTISETNDLFVPEPGA